MALTDFTCLDEQHASHTVSWGIVGFALSFTVAFCASLFSGLPETMGASMTFSGCSLSCANALAYTLSLFGCMGAGAIGACLFGGFGHLMCSVCESSDDAREPLTNHSASLYDVVVNGESGDRNTVKYQFQTQFHHHRAQQKGFQVVKSGQQSSIEPALLLAKKDSHTASNTNVLVS